MEQTVLKGRSIILQGTANDHSLDVLSHIVRTMAFMKKTNMTDLVLQGCGKEEPAAGNGMC